MFEIYFWTKPDIKSALPTKLETAREMHSSGYEHLEFFTVRDEEQLLIFKAALNAVGCECVSFGDEALSKDEKRLKGLLELAYELADDDDSDDPLEEVEIFYLGLEPDSDYSWEQLVSKSKGVTMTYQTAFDALINSL